MKAMCFFVTASGMAVVAGCASPGMHGDATVVAQGGSRPSWVADTGARTQKKLADVVGLDASEYHFLVAEASSDAGEQNLPSCYEFAGANASNEIAAELYTEIKGTTATAADEGSRAQYGESLKIIRGKVVGARILAKYWETVESKNKERKTLCWVIQGIPTKNYEQLKKFAEAKLKDGSAGVEAKRVKESVQKTQDQSIEKTEQ